MRQSTPAQGGNAPGAPMTMAESPTSGRSRPRVPLTAAGQPRTLEHDVLDTPVGPLFVAADAAGVHYVLFNAARHDLPPAIDWVPAGAALDPVRLQLTEYFAGTRRTFSVPLTPAGTAFQCRVWAELERIPFGDTISYGELARRIGDPKAVRAVGLANGANPIAVIIPCHRVIGSAGTLVGYGGGLPIKQALLALERGQGRLL